MIYTVIHHFKALLQDLEEAADDGSWTIDPMQEPLRQAAFMAAHEAIEAMNGYYLDQNSAKLNQLLINAGMNFNQRWDNWLAESEMKTATKLFHSMLLRFSKGTMKFWRGWLIDLSK